MRPFPWSLSQPRRQTRAVLLLSAATLCLGSMALAGCRDTRPDADYCSACVADAGLGATRAGSSTADAISAGSAPPGDGPATRPAGQAGAATGTEPAAAMASQPGMGAAGASTATPSNNAGAGPSGGTGTAGAPAMIASGEGGAVDGGTSRADSGHAGSHAPDLPRDAGTIDAMLPEGQTMATQPCGRMCSGDQPVCDEISHSCVQCLRDDQCLGATPACDTLQHACVQCLRDDHCPDAAPVCDTQQHTCVQCVAGDQRACTDRAPVCNHQNQCVVCSNDVPNSCPLAQPICDREQRCVECLPGMTGSCPPDRGQCSPQATCVACTDNTHCTTKEQPRCDTASFSCAGCAGPNDCLSFSDLPYCDEQTHECVACTKHDEQFHCAAGEFCDRNTHTCMPSAPKLPGCAPCNTDDECAVSTNVAACVVQPDNQGYCLIAAPPDGTCEPGYTPRRPPGRTQDYCTPAPDPACKSKMEPPGPNTISCDPLELGACGTGALCDPSTGRCVSQCDSDLDCMAPLICNLRAHMCTRASAGRD